FAFPTAADRRNVAACVVPNRSHPLDQPEGHALANHAPARCLQSIVAMTYFSWRQQSDSRNIWRAWAATHWCPKQGRDSARCVERRLIWGQVRLVRCKSRPAYPEPANPVVLGEKRRSVRLGR